MNLEYLKPSNIEAWKAGVWNREILKHFGPFYTGILKLWLLKPGMYGALDPTKCENMAAFLSKSFEALNTKFAKSWKS